MSIAPNHESDTLTSATPRDLDFYEVDSSSIDDSARRLLIDYSGFTKEEVGPHVDAIRKKAFAIFAYPCIGMYRFLDLSLGQRKEYPEIVRRLRGGEKFLDLGCCFGQEIRQLVADGVPSENTYGSDLRQEFIDLGYDLFQDKGKIKTTFLAANVFDNDSPLQQIYGQMSIVYTGSFFHLFDYKEQIDAATRVVQLLTPEKGTMIVGRQVGNVNAGDFNTEGYSGEKGRFRHNPTTWTEFWDEVGEATGTSWKVDAEWDNIAFESSEKKLTALRLENGARRMRFVVTRV
ncbi:hypothetical protein FKW77_007383 [Venturia effusa]|uniref:Methyltransferase domain-containing protein n=1 Tax=Venturia effusa TaxID=50376 RepID=A0A517LFX2_9PEZI|nr:hypothetical protein FKW77_007383 [Venturia effusa]